MTTSPGRFIVIDGPSGVGKSTVTRLLAQRLTAAGHDVLTTSEPSNGPIGELARGGTHDYQGLTLACLVAADRYHHLATQIHPALAQGHIVVCDRYLPSSLVLQHLDGVPDTFLWQLNASADRPDLTILLVGEDETCQRRARQRGTYSRFHAGLMVKAPRTAGSSGRSATRDTAHRCTTSRAPRRSRWPTLSLPQ